jgi:hypothetical protein
MKNIFLASILLLATMGFAQYPQSPNGPPQTTPPTFPGHPGERMPPEQNGRPLSTDEVQQQIKQRLASQEELANTDVKVKASEDLVTLSGAVDTEQQHRIALRVAESYAGDRKIVDTISVGPQKQDTNRRPL